MFLILNQSVKQIPWNKGLLVGQKLPLLPKETWAIRARLTMEKDVRGLALFNTAIDSKLRGCDLLRLKVSDIMQGGEILHRVIFLQQKTK